MGMVVFYQGSSARITETAYEARLPYEQCVAIRDISYVFSSVTGRVTARPLLVGSSSTAGLLALAAWFGWPGVDPPTWVGAALALAVVASLTARTIGDRGLTYQLWAVVYGVKVLLMQTLDEREFAQVRAGLQAALETRPDRC
jgi:uncharacterized protein DUF6232